MIKISKELFVEYLEHECMLTLTYKKEQYEIYNMYSYDELGEKEYEGLFVNNDRIKNIDTVIKKFKLGDEIDIDSINGYEDYDEFLRNYVLNDISMEKLVENYSEANKFTLIMKCDYEHTYNKKQLDDAYEYVLSENKRALQEMYEQQKIKEPFEKVYNDIKEECLNFRKNYGDVYKDNFENSLICEQVGDDTKYYKPYQFFYHFYQLLGMEVDLKERQENLVGEQYDLDVLLPAQLRKNLIKTELTYYSYSCLGPLQMVFYFNLNDETKGWLKQFENDYQLETLEDLAFYQDDKRIFMSITHENTHEDLR